LAVRLNRRHGEMVREKIRASQLVNRLQDHAFGKVEMTRSQVDAAQFLLNKIIPNPPQKLEHSGSIDLAGALKAARERVSGT
jgi:hypothetical protein